jgi:hypothetical protein
MQDRINKPRVFLSHSKLDVDFIERLAGDLRRCQIEPWIDSAEIRDGRSWQQMIFGEGIPSCEAVLVYFTENSLASQMVGKEVDAVLIEQLSGKGISFLPYVSASLLRGRLRSDVRSLQCREWNDGNYKDVLPSVVAEIWRSYLEWAVRIAVSDEKVGRLEAEKELMTIKDQLQSSVFRPAEEVDFEYIFAKLNEPVSLEFDIMIGNGQGGFRPSGDRVTLKASFLDVVICAAQAGYAHFDFNQKDALNSAARRLVNRDTGAPHVMFRGIRGTVGEVLDLQVYGLTAPVSHLAARPRSRESVYYKHEFTDKFQRFRYWIEYTGRTPTRVDANFEPVPAEGSGLNPA